MRCESFDNDAIDNLDPAVAEQLAIDRNGKINEAGAYITGLYWDLGAALLKLRELYGKHGEWERKLARMGIERTRATKAMRIKQTFSRRADCQQLSVERAYAMRKRKKTVEYDTPHPPDHSCFTPNESLRVYNCRFEDLEQLGGVKPETVDLLLTDPPYLQEWLTQMPTLAGFVARALKPGGRAVFYYGNMFLNHLLREMEAKHINYLWTFCHPYAAGSCRSINRRGIQQDWKPVVLFAKGEWRSEHKIQDMLPAFPREKGRDYWEQSLPLLEHLLEMFSSEGDLVLDPLAGTCTILEACHNKGRKCIACDSNPAAMTHARQRWEAIKRRVYDDLHDDAAVMKGELAAAYPLASGSGRDRATIAEIEPTLAQMEDPTG